MPHVIVEYTSNLKDDGDIKALLQKINEVLIVQGDTFPIGGIRTRAIALHDYVVADGSHKDDAFVHVTLKIGAGRSEEIMREACDRLFDVVQKHFEAIFAERYLALSLELIEFSHPTYKKNNIHRRYQTE
ncbi:5-carboxymethyl-2-hydroxymuconate Delta-isomerase [Ornithinibacillus contaminans]|uniref:5-carboxymethyl-2-hydroxymuconate Delta-isomerase n=1 Tax=Ornithinibacillus contaminans TaxID=694055 RepID=UPI00064DD886|nr:5-carboxymethyl-2-hydroxymuconate Delta-isomerase [Ornithinibacillus contaminans]